MAASAAIVAVVVVVVTLRELSWTTDVGLTLPNLDLSLAWLGVWPVWMALSERLFERLGVPQPERWSGDEGRRLLALRFVGMVLLAPFAEELMFRGLLYSRFDASPIGLVGAVLVPALAFAALHFQYGWRECLWIFLDGALLGLARWHSDALVYPMLMHAAGNAHAYYQRFPR